jgi:hypothetical protein
MYRILGTIDGQLTVNTFVYTAGVPAPTTLQLSTLLTNISTNMFVAYKNCLSADWASTAESLTVVHRNDIATTVSTVNAAIAGARAAGHEPSEVAAILNRITALKGQHGRGRCSLPGIATADVSGSRLAGAIIGVMTTLCGKMTTTASDGSNTWIPSLGTRSLTSPRLVTSFALLTNASVNTLLGTVRRRKIGRGK